MIDYSQFLRSELLELLSDVAELLEGYADVKDGPDGPVPDRAMALLTRVQACIQKAGG